MSRFQFIDYGFDESTKTAFFTYGYDDGRCFTEKVVYDQVSDGYNKDILNKTLFLAFLVAGTSYFKTFPTPHVEFKAGSIDEWQAKFLNEVYSSGLSQYAFENQLTQDDLAHFQATGVAEKSVAYDGTGMVVLQSGGKDSLLTAALLERDSVEYVPWYISSSDHHPAVLDDLKFPLVTTRRIIDIEALKNAQNDGARNGHVPVTYIVQSYALIQAVLLGKSDVITSIGHEGEEPHAMIGSLAVTHQWSKTWQAEQLFATYVQEYISPDIRVGSPLRQYSELRVSELFVQHAWSRFGHRFSSCNRANYLQGEDNTELHWCGDCPKCANAYVLFAPFVDAHELQSLFAGQDLFTKPSLQETFKGLLSIDGSMKPFECVGEVDELRYAYHLSQARPGYGKLPFDVPVSQFDYLKEYPSQPWARLEG